MHFIHGVDERSLPRLVAPRLEAHLATMPEDGDRLLPIEVKSTTRPRLDDARGIRAFRAEYGSAARAGLLLHDGETTEWLLPDVLAAPWWKVI